MSDYDGIDRADLAEVQALNRACLRLMRRREGQVSRDHLPEPIAARIQGLTDWELERLAGIPVLLGISVANTDYWDQWFDREAQTHLFEESPAPTPTADVAVATLLFLWQLSRTNPYAARLVSGASVSWCERLAGYRLAWLVRRIRSRSDFLLPRHATHAHFWQRLLDDGVSEDPSVRHAAHLCAMQTALTVAETVTVDRFRTAACQTPTPALRVADAD